MTKKIISVLTILVMLLAFLPVRMKASETTKLTIQPDKTEAHPGDVITYTAKINAVANLGGLKFKLVIPEGLTYVNGSGTTRNNGLRAVFDDPDHPASISFDETSMNYVSGSFPSQYTSTSDTILMTFQCSVDAFTTGTSVTKSIGISDEANSFECINYSQEHISLDISDLGSSVQITIPSTDISLNKHTISINEGQTEDISATLSPEATTDTITWSSSDETVATVVGKSKTNATITANKIGSATITARTTSGESDSCVVTVSCAHTNKETIQAKAPNCTEDGNYEYKKCTECQKMFNSDGTTEVTENDILRPRLGHDYIIKKDTTKHWSECSRCGATKNQVDHSAVSETFQSDGTGHWHKCSCDEKIDFAQHTERVIKDNTIDPTCTESGSHTEKIVCSICGYTIIDTHTVTDPENGHTAGTPTRENEVPATCTKKGSYDEVVYCSICEVEISREEKEIDMIDHSAASDTWEYDDDYHWKSCGCGTELEKAAHIGGEAVQENIVPATCTKKGSYDEVVYCSVCGVEMSRIEKDINIKEHEGANPVRENEVPATCTEDGEYEKVVYCKDCHEELSRNTETIEAKGHVAGEAVKENEVASTVDSEGSYDEVVYCSVCGVEMSRNEKTTPKFVYEVLEGKDSEYEYNSKEPVTFRVNGIFAKFKGIKIDGEIIDSSNYTAKSGSTIVTLSEKYVSMLEKGAHKIAFIYDDGEIETNFTISEEKEPDKEKTDGNKNSMGPKTSDESNMVMWINGLIISGILFGVIFKWSKREKRIKRNRH